MKRKINELLNKDGFWATLLVGLALFTCGLIALSLLVIVLEVIR